ncbi:FecR domain-containing protein [Brevundimonas sp.]|uniref:FecR family protein n=1 Tax=Brevundimonas sp. TaxID=1871086 RepID=UPI0028AC2276|nr:FecR domain-containing protein [Brevundimonas sp.]
MAGANTRVATADREAAEWHARLGVRRVSTRTIEDFFAWRAAPGNAEAYSRVERVWAESDRLAGHPRIQEAVSEVMTRSVGRSLHGRYRRVMFATAMTTAAGLICLGVWLWADGRSMISTEVGEERLVQLSDGSTVRLDTGSAVRLRMSGVERRVELQRGQALFRVAPDRTRPFIVEASGTRVTALGTVFDVRRTDAAVRVTLVEGVVEVSGDQVGEPSRMRAGEQTRVTSAGVTTQRVDTAKATGWTEGRLVLEDMPLRTAVAEVNRYLTDPIILAPNVRGEVPVNGVFRTGDRTAFASAAAAGLGLEARIQGDGSLLLSQRKNN